MNNAVFGKVMENVRKHRDSKLVATNKEGIIQYQNQIIKLQNFFPQYLLVIEMKKTETHMNKSVQDFQYQNDKNI